MKTVIKYIRPYLFPFVFCLLIKAVSAFFELVIPRMLAVIIDENIPASDLRAVLINGAIMLGCAFLTFLFNVIGNKMSARVTGYVAKDLRHDLFEKTLHLDAKDTDKIGISSLTSRLTADTYNVMSFLARIQRLGVKAPLMLIGGVLVTLTIDVRLALILIGILPIVSFVTFKITKKSIPIYDEEQRILDRVVRRVDETSSGIRVIKALSKSEYEKARFTEESDALAGKEIQAGKVMSLTKPINDFVFYMGFCLVIVVGYFMSLSDGAGAAGKLLAFMTYFTIILNNMIMMSRIFVQTSRTIASAGRIEEVLKTGSEFKVEDLPINESGYIVFDNVSFSYNKIRSDIKNLSFTLGKGETLGIIGATGSGKSTVVSLLLRLYDPDEGNIYVGGRNLKSIPTRELYSMVGAVLQNDFIPSETIEENVSFYRDISEECVKGALLTAKADFAVANDGGIAYSVNSRGTNLSGGQRQRLLIARALASKPPILILDDCASALDYKTEKELRAALAKERRDATVIVSQRIASVMSADKIIVLDNGECVGVGNHEELLLTSSHYREVWTVQKR